MKSNVRYNNVEMFSNLFNIKKYISYQLEKKIYELSEKYIIENNLNNILLTNIYNDKIKLLIENINEDKYKILIDKYKDIKILATLSPIELNEQKWEYNKNKLLYCENLKNNITTTDRYQCYKCKERKTIVTQKQTRCGDEGATFIVVCVNCGNTFKM